MTVAGNIASDKIKKHDVLYFENYVSRSFKIIDDVQEEISYTMIELSFKSNEITIYSGDTKREKWDNPNGMHRSYEYCKNPRLAIEDIFTHKIEFFEGRL